MLYFGQRLKHLAFLQIGIINMDLAEDYVGFLWIPSCFELEIIKEILNTLKAKYGVPIRATNSSPLMLQALFIDE
jgi:hypothetical protein